ncbi:MAG: hypothetical protein ACC650_10275 [Gammaproteobacteria bacterium]
MHNYRHFILCFTLFFSGNAFSQDDDNWQFVLTPVLWNASVEASLSDNDSGGDLPINPDYNFFTLDNLDDYLSLKFEANHGRFGILFDSLRARYQDQTANKNMNLIVGTELGFAELSARYQLSREFELDLIGGVRYTFLNLEQTLVLPNRVPAKRQEHNWTDPLIGLRYHYLFADRWHAWVRGDIGGYNVGTQRIINFTADMQYIINTYLSFSLGYRYLKIDFKEDDVLYDVSLNGLQIGLGIHF